MRTSMIAVIAGLLAAPAGTAMARKRAPSPGPKLDVIKYRLDNGLEVILVPDATMPSVVVNVWHKVGSIDETPGKTGFAHLFEHLMFKGSKHVADGQWDLILERAGGWNNAETGNDSTDYYEQVPVNFLDQALWLEADRMAGLWDAMNQTVLDNQRDVVKNERRETIENEPYGRAELMVQQALWPEGHGNHNLTIGTMEDLTAASLDDVEAFWRMWYRPSNATLIIGGGIDVDATRKMVDTYFAWMPAQDPPVRRGLDGPVTPMDKPVELTTTDDVTVPKVSLAFRTDVPYSAVSSDLELAAQVLGGGKTSRLYRRLVMKDRLATEVDASYQPLLLGGEFHINAIARAGVDPVALRKAIDEEVAAVRDNLVSADELLRARRTLESDLLMGLESIVSRVASIAAWDAYTGDPDYLAEQLALFDAVTPDSLQATAKTWLAASAAVTMIVKPEDKQ